LRQHPIVYGGNKDREDFFVADFYCHEKKLVIELDGGIHNEQKLYDENRDEIINELGIHVLRMKNEIMEKPTESLNTINDFILDNNL
jgi:leucyl-tRNA synthetase